MHNLCLGEWKPNSNKSRKKISNLTLSDLSLLPYQEQEHKRQRSAFYTMATILVLHGPNLNLLGHREPDVYGTTTLVDINEQLTSKAREAGHHLLTLQSNAEYELIERIHDAKQEGVNYIIINPAAFTHTSIALRDALLGVGIPFIEVHLSNIHDREPFRQHSYFSDVAEGVISGFGSQSYQIALQAALQQLAVQPNQA